MLFLELSVGLLLGVILGATSLWAVLHFYSRSTLLHAHAERDKLIDAAKRDADAAAREIDLKHRQEQLALKEASEKEADVSRKKLAELELRLTKREDVLDRKQDSLTAKERDVGDLEKRCGQRAKDLDSKEIELVATLRDQKERLLNITGMSTDQAQQMLLARIENECRSEAGEVIRRITEQTQEEAKEKSRQIILQAIQRYASEQTADHTVSSVTITDDAMKGRVIGREGRNIRAFEKTTGVDVIIDDTPGVVTVSCFDPVRREIARQSMERLVGDGRIQPQRIEEVVAIVAKEMEENLMKLGKDAAQNAGVHNLNKAIIPLLGRLHFRTSYGQNVLKHSIEVAYLAQVMADELGLDGTLARRAGLLHDIGKAMDHDQEGGHPQLGHEFLRKYNEPEAVLNAALGHHGDVPASTMYTPLIMAADAISASRPGARRESLEKYVKRLKDLEDLASAFDGVRQAYAIQAGREVRVIVDARSVDDRGSVKLARDIARKVEADLKFPGEIKVTVLREVRTVEYAR